jgi:hypothetical protein
MVFLHAKEVEDIGLTKINLVKEAKFVYSNPETGAHGRWC